MNDVIYIAALPFSGKSRLFKFLDNNSLQLKRSYDTSRSYDAVYRVGNTIIIDMDTNQLHWLEKIDVGLLRIIGSNLISSTGSKKCLMVGNSLHFADVIVAKKDSVVSKINNDGRESEEAFNLRRSIFYDLRNKVLKNEDDRYKALDVDIGEVLAHLGFDYEITNLFRHNLGGTSIVRKVLL